MTPRDPADGWVDGPRGRFWGRAGAAGLLAVHDDRVLLQHRVGWSHFGGTWGLPGGARGLGEGAVDGALRESAEEAAVPRDALRLVSTSVLDLGYWSYTTVVARVTRPFDPVVSDAESTALEWVPVDRVDASPLHPGLAASWPGLRDRLGRRLRLVVDAANVVGSRPDGWWRDRAGATDRLLDRLGALSASGVTARWAGLGDVEVGGALTVSGDSGTVEGGVAEVPGGDAPVPRLDRVWPDVTVVVEGRARDVADREGDLEVVRAAGSGDDAVVEVLRAGGGDDLVVVTADRELGERVRAEGAHVVRPSALLDLLPAD